MKKAVLTVAMLSTFAVTALAGNRVVIFDNIATEVAVPSMTLPGSEDLWVTLADLTNLAEGFADLNRAALDAEERRATEARAAEDKRALDAGAASRGDTTVPAPAPDLALRIFDLRDADVTPPVVERQDISRWVSTLPRPRPGTNLGSIEVVVDESGAVTGAMIRASVSRFYDTVLLESSKLWHYRPATRQGRPVKYRRVVGIVMGG